MGDRKIDESSHAIEQITPKLKTALNGNKEQAQRQ